MTVPEKIHFEQTVYRQDLRITVSIMSIYTLSIYTHLYLYFLRTR